jgi:hypothetical protein
MNLLLQQIEWLQKRVELHTYDRDYVIFAMQEYARKYHESKVKELNLDFVRQQREQLKAFMRWQENQDIEQFDDQPATIERYLESL